MYFQRSSSMLIDQSRVLKIVKSQETSSLRLSVIWSTRRWSSATWTTWLTEIPIVSIITFANSLMSVIQHSTRTRRSKRSTSRRRRTLIMMPCSDFNWGENGSINQDQVLTSSGSKNLKPTTHKSWWRSIWTRCLIRAQDGRSSSGRTRLNSRAHRARIFSLSRARLMTWKSTEV